MTASSRLGPLQSHSRHTIFNSTSLDVWSAQYRILYLTTHSTERYRCLEWDLNPQSQQVSSCRPMRHTTRRGVGKDISLAFINVVALTKWRSHASSNPSAYVYVRTYSENPVTFKNTAAILEHVLNSMALINYGTVFKKFHNIFGGSVLGNRKVSWFPCQYYNILLLLLLLWHGKLILALSLLIYNTYPLKS